MFLNTTQTPGWGRNEGTEMKVSCCSPVCAYVQLEAVAKQTQSIGLNPWEPASKTQPCTSLPGCCVTTVTVVWSRLLGLWPGAESLCRVGHSGHDALWQILHSTARERGATALWELRGEAWGCAAVALVEIVFRCGVCEELCTLWLGVALLSPWQRNAADVSSSASSILLVQRKMSAMCSVFYMEQVPVSINIWLPLHSQAVQECMEQRTGWIHVNVNLQGRASKWFQSVRTHLLMCCLTTVFPGPGSHPHCSSGVQNSVWVLASLQGRWVLLLSPFITCTFILPHSCSPSKSIYFCQIGCSVLMLLVWIPTSEFDFGFELDPKVQGMTLFFWLSSAFSFPLALKISRLLLRLVQPVVWIKSSSRFH